MTDTLDSLPLDRAIDTVRAHLQDVRGALNAGKTVDLAALDIALSSLCQRVMQADQSMKHAMLPAMETMLHTLDDLANDLRGRTESPDLAHRASRAYQAAPARATDTET